MIVPFVVHDASGVILRSGACPAEMVGLQARAGETAMVGNALDDTHYVDTGTGQIAAKIALGAAINKVTVTANGVDFVVISNLPVPTQYRVSGPAQGMGEVVDGVLELTFDVPGTYCVALNALHRLTQVFEVTAT